jgi:tRNA (cytidine/uridine-2'-O-)-methyltransferase
MLHLVLYAPEIPNNTGTIGRTAVAVGARLHLIKPLGFDLGEKALRRAGLDYWQDLDLRVHDDWAAFLATEQPARLWALTARASRSVWEARFQDGDYLLFGGESDGLPDAIKQDVHGRWGDDVDVGLPQQAGIRSLNLACAATAATYEALRQIRAGAQ